MDSQRGAWLAAAPSLTPLLNAVTEETPFTATPPWLRIAASSASDWSTKTEIGAEIHVTLELVYRGDQPNAAAALIGAIDSAVRALPPKQTGFVITSIVFVRSQAAQHSPATRTISLVYRFRTQAV